tara:strand:+ start:252 stop:536 length:285 start_codon:yes stop_codon:yes gene_type:complete
LLALFLKVLVGLLDKSLPALENWAMLELMGLVAANQTADAGETLIMGLKAGGLLPGDSEAERHVDLHIYKSDFPSGICRNGVDFRHILHAAVDM